MNVYFNNILWCRFFHKCVFLNIVIVLQRKLYVNHYWTNYRMLFRMLVRILCIMYCVINYKSFGVLNNLPCAMRCGICLWRTLTIVWITQFLDGIAQFLSDFIKRYVFIFFLDWSCLVIDSFSFIETIYVICIVLSNKTPRVLLTFCLVFGLI